MGWRDSIKKRVPGVASSNQSNREASNSNPQAQHLRQVGDKKLDAGEYAVAASFYEEAIKLTPNDADLILSRALAYRLSTPPNYIAASADANSAIGLSPDNWNAWYMKGEILAAVKDFGGAEEAFQNALGLASRMDKLRVQSSLAEVRSKKAAQPARTRSSPHSDAVELDGSGSPSSATVPSPSGASQRTIASNTAPSTAPSTVPIFVPSTASTNTAQANQLPRPRPTQPAPPQREHTTSDVNQTPSAATGFTSAEISALMEDIQNEPPPYTANPNPPPQSGPLQFAEINSRTIALGTTMAARNKGRLMIRPYTAAQSIDAIQLMYVGLTSGELTTRENPIPSYLHISHHARFVDILTYPGTNFLDQDPETSSYYEGKLPGTTTISGYSEEYRLHQLYISPALNFQFESLAQGLPVVNLSDIVARLQKQITPTSVEDNEGLKPFLGMSQTNTLQFGFGPGGTLQKRIDNLCYMLTRSLFDEPTRFQDFSRIRNFSNILRAAHTQEPKLRDFLYQILIGSELLLRLGLQLVGPSYAGIVTNNISCLIATADLFTLNVMITEIPRTIGTANPRYKFFPKNHKLNGEGLIKFAEAIGWPLLEEAKRTIEAASAEFDAGRMPAGDDLCDWMYGLILPGKIFRHRIMCALVEASPSIRSWRGAPYYENGLVVMNKSYWPQRTVFGRVLGGLRNPKSICGWIGPGPAPRGEDPIGNPVSGWVRLTVRQTNVHPPVIRSANPLQAYGFGPGNTETDTQMIDAMTDPNEYILPAPLNPPPNHRGSVLRGINLDLILGVQSVLNLSTLGLPSETYRASMDFEIDGNLVRYNLYYNPVFVTAPPCVGTHPMFRRLVDQRLRDAVPAANLKSTVPTAGKLLIINALHDGDEIVARAWCAENGKHGIVRRNIPGFECCFTCACNLAVGDSGLNCNVLIWSK